MTTSGDPDLPDDDFFMDCRKPTQHKVTNADALVAFMVIIGIAGVVGAFWTKSAFALIPTVLALIFFAAK